MKTTTILLQTFTVICLMLTGKASAQHIGGNGVTTEQITLIQQTTFKAEAIKNLTKALETVITESPQVTESKIQKRVRKKKDPILIPYALNKKNFSIC